MSDPYFNAAIPEPYRILGLTLRPLSIGRYRLLKRFGCAFVADCEATAGISDLLVGILVCSQRVGEFLELAYSPEFTKEIRKWSRRICPCPAIGLLPFIGKWWRNRHSFDVLEKISLFRQYLKDGSAMPKYWDHSEATKESGAHWSQAVEVVLRSKLGWTAEEINEAPMTKAFQDYFTYAEGNGLVQLMTEDEIKFIEQAEKEGGASGS